MSIFKDVSFEWLYFGARSVDGMSGQRETTIANDLECLISAATMENLHNVFVVINGNKDKPKFLEWAANSGILAELIDRNDFWKEVKSQYNRSLKTHRTRGKLCDSELFENVWKFHFNRIIELADIFLSENKSKYKTDNLEVVTLKFGFVLFWVILTKDIPNIEVCVRNDFLDYMIQKTANNN